MLPNDRDQKMMINGETSQHDELETASVGSIGSLNSLVLENDLKDDIEKRKKYKRGVVYMAFIPPAMTPTILRRLLSEFAEIERIFLQPENKRGKKPSKKDLAKMKNIKYSEGWIEFLKKRDAKRVAALLNNTHMGGKKKSRFREYLWNLKYLPRFKWIHLCERLSYETAVKQQRLRAEVSQAKKIANHFAQSVDKEEKLKRKKKSAEPLDIHVPDGLLKPYPMKRSPEREDSQDKRVEDKREDFFKSLFG